MNKNIILLELFFKAGCGSRMKLLLPDSLQDPVNNKQYVPLSCDRKNYRTRLKDCIIRHSDYYRHWSTRPVLELLINKNTITDTINDAEL